MLQNMMDLSPEYMKDVSSIKCMLKEQRKRNNVLTYLLAEVPTTAICSALGSDGSNN